MTTKIETPNVTYADGITSGYGHKLITVELESNGEYRRFKAITNDMPGWDEANDLDGQERYEALYELIENKIEDDVIEWLVSIN